MLSFEASRNTGPVLIGLDTAKNIIKSTSLHYEIA